MRKFATVDDENRLDSLDREHLSKYSFKASFIGHISSVADKKAEYRRRMQTLDNRKSTKQNSMHQAFLEKKLLQAMNKQSSRSQFDLAAAWDGGSARAALGRYVLLVVVCRQTC